MYSLNRRFIVLYNVNLFASSWSPHFLDTVTDKITLYLKACVLNQRDRSTKRTTTEIQQNLQNSNNSNSPLNRAKFPFNDQNFTEIYPGNSSSPLTRTAFHFPSEFELPGFYCINKYIELLLVTANEQFIRSCSQAHVHHIVQ